MGAAKEKRIKKLKKIKIGPAIVGLVVLMTISSFLIFLAGVVSVSDIAQRKLVRAGEQAVRIAELYDQEGVDKLLAANEDIYSYVELIPEIETVSIMSKNGQKVWSNNKTYPLMDKTMFVDLQAVGINQNIRMYIDEELDQLITVRDGSIVLNRESVADTLSNIISGVKNFLASHEDGFDLFQANISLMSMKIWLAVAGNQYDVYVLNDPLFR